MTPWRLDHRVHNGQQCLSIEATVETVLRELRKSMRGMPCDEHQMRRSPFLKQLRMNFDSLLEFEDKGTSYYGKEAGVKKLEMMNARHRKSHYVPIEDIDALMSFRYIFDENQHKTLDGIAKAAAAKMNTVAAGGLKRKVEVDLTASSSSSSTAAAKRKAVKQVGSTHIV